MITGYEAYLGTGKSKTFGNWGNFMRACYREFCDPCHRGLPPPWGDFGPRRSTLRREQTGTYLTA